MSDIVLMNETVDNYESGEVYRVRSRNAQDFLVADAAELVPFTKIDFDPEDPVEHEGV